MAISRGLYATLMRQGERRKKKRPREKRTSRRARRLVADKSSGGLHWEVALSVAQKKKVKKSAGARSGPH
jgi:hypothetical protein